jgi:hypothetical protein
MAKSVLITFHLNSGKTVLFSQEVAAETDLDAEALAELCRLIRNHDDVQFVSPDGKRAVAVPNLSNVALVEILALGGDE